MEGKTLNSSYSCTSSISWSKSPTNNLTVIVELSDVAVAVAAAAEDDVVDGTMVADAADDKLLLLPFMLPLPAEEVKAAAAPWAWAQPIFNGSLEAPTPKRNPSRPRILRAAAVLVRPTKQNQGAGGDDMASRGLPECADPPADDEDCPWGRTIRTNRMLLSSSTATEAEPG